MKLIVTILLSILTLTRVIKAYFVQPQQISEVEESFVKGQIEYVMLNIRVTWDEAEIVCQSLKNGSLAIVNTIEIAKFIAEALSETNLEMEDLWIGAKKQKGVTGYVWLKGAGVYVPDGNFIKRGKENFQNISRDCLSFARKYHLDPEYINLECDLKRPFICEKPYEKVANGSMTIPEWVIVGKYKYGIFYAEKTWKESIMECRRKYNAHLASFRNNEEVKAIGKYLLIGRPSLENAWIGAYFKNGNWKMLHNGKVLAEKPDNKTNFPPWREDRPLKHSGCALLDRHLANHPVFLEARCERRRSYICSKGPPHPDYSVIIIEDTGYVIYFVKKTWEEALLQCQSHEASLVKVTIKNIHDVTYIMGENVTEINHVWIGGKLTDNGANFYWIIDNQPIPPNNIDPSHYPPWFDNEYDLNYACLNLDRENHNRPLFYGVACGVAQEFICEQKDLSKLPQQPEFVFRKIIKTRSNDIQIPDNVTYEKMEFH